LLAAAHDRGPYVLQASIAQCHAVATSAAATDWSRIVSLYDELVSIDPSPVVRLNRAIAIGMRDGPDAGLALLADVALELDGFHLVPLAQADLLRRAGRMIEAAARYRQSIEQAPNGEEAGQLQRRLARLV
jgi:RNA polymerase sigma-70 factor (ECF subfamily)